MITPIVSTSTLPYDSFAYSMTRIIPIICICTFLFSCQSPQSDQVTVEKYRQVKNQYATGFTVTDSTIVVHQPYPGAQDPQIFTLNTPAKRVIVTGTSHLPYLELLGVGDRLVGFPGIQYIYSPYFLDRAENGLITEMGPDNGLNLELLFSLAPDLVIAFDMGSESTYLDKIQQAGIPILYNSDFLEPTLLGRAEWIKVFGALFDKQTEADSVFQIISGDYERLKKRLAGISTTPSAFSGIMYGDAWFLPGGQNGSSQLISDAGGKYLWQDNVSTGWLELSFESVFEKANQADFWIGMGTLQSLEEVAALDPRYVEFAAFKNQKVYHYNKRIGPQGGYDYFESGYARPDLVLADLVAIFHPEILPQHEFVYFQALK